MKTLVCSVCGNEVVRTAPTQMYCRPCSEIKDLERKRKWAKYHYPENREILLARTQKNNVSRNGRMRRQGAEINAMEAAITEEKNIEIKYFWSVGVSVPFTWALSKNHLWTLARRGHVYLREDSRAARDGLILSLSQSLKGITPINGKLWVDLIVQKPNHRGDAINLLSAVCDAIKVATGIDDRWYSVRRLDWQIVKDNPQLILRIGQEVIEPERVCSYCGRSLPIDRFALHGRICQECRSAARRG